MGKLGGGVAKGGQEGKTNDFFFLNFGGGRNWGKMVPKLFE